MTTGKWLTGVLILILLTAGTAFGAGANRIQPGDLKYLGAFRLPGGSGGSDFYYSGNALAFRNDGDPGGGGDGYAGSLFLTGNDTQLYVAEISIPAPVVSKSRAVGELKAARAIQPLTNVFSPLIDYLEQPRAGLCYLPGRSGSGGRLHYSLGLHLQDTGFEPSHGWFAPDLSGPKTAGPYVFGSYTGYVTNDYLCRIPEKWADANAPGTRLAAGRAREGPWAGGGPALFAYDPGSPDNPPARGTRLNPVPLLLYGEQPAGSPEIVSRADQQLPGNSDSDRFRACEWITAGDRSAVIFAGTKAEGQSWYGFANGVRWAYDCGQAGQPPCPAVPEWPNDNRGFWADDFKAVFLFYDPVDLAAVAGKRQKSWTPRPYAVLDLAPFLLDPDYTKEDLIRYKRDFVGAMTFDPESRLLFLMEPVVNEDGESVVHVFRIGR